MARLFFAMLGIQVAIGALNDVADAPLDAIGKPGKPIPMGLVSRRVALGVAAGGALGGVVLSALSGPGTLVVGASCLALGWLYDLRLSRTALSWLPLSVALPLLPVHAWLGATGSLPAGLVGLVPVGVLAGAGLAIANGLVDLDRDAGAGRPAIAVALGRRRGWVVQTVLLGGAAALAVLLAPGGPGSAAPGAGGGAAEGLAPLLTWLRSWGLTLGCASIAIGALVLGSFTPAIRERGWELEALGVAAMGVAWLAGLSPLAPGA